MPVNANFNEFETNMGNKTQFNWKKRRKKETSYNNNNNKLNNEFNAHFNPSSFHSFELRLSRFDALIHTRIGWFDIPINKERKTMSFCCLAVFNWKFVRSLLRWTSWEWLNIVTHNRHKHNMSMQKYEAEIRICCADYRVCVCASFELIRSKSAIRWAYTKIGE